MILRWPKNWSKIVNWQRPKIHHVQNTPKWPRKLNENILEKVQIGQKRNKKNLKLIDKVTKVKPRIVFLREPKKLEKSQLNLWFTYAIDPFLHFQIWAHDLILQILCHRQPSLHHPQILSCLSQNWRPEPQRPF